MGHVYYLASRYAHALILDMANEGGENAQTKPVCHVPAYLESVGLFRAHGSQSRVETR